MHLGESRKAWLFRERRGNECGYCLLRLGVAPALLYYLGAKEVNEHRVDEVPLG